ncbi:MAG: M3 family oligoendopeptidase [Chloroflexota bacterium]
MFETLPKNPKDVLPWTWEKYQPFVDKLLAREIDAGNVHQYLADWTRLAELWDETEARLYIATALDTTDQNAQQAFDTFLEGVYPNSQAADQKIKEKFLASGLEPEGFDIPLRNLRAQADLFRDANLPLLTQETKLCNAYDKIIGAQSVMWQGEEKTISQMIPIYQDADRDVRAKAWQRAFERQLDDRAAINDLWGKFMSTREQLAANAQAPDYRAYAWQKMLRFAYTPEDCITFQEAIEKVVVPAAERIYERRKKRLGVDTLRPWDLWVDPLNRDPLRPFEDVSELEAKAAVIFNKVDPQLGGYFATMQQEGLLDTDNRKGKAPGAFSYTLSSTRKPFVFQNAVGLHDDVQTLLHEGGHAFHAFESNHLPYFQQQTVPMEFAEVASMAMELLAAPYLSEDEGGFYSETDAARARIEHLEEAILFWPYMTVVDAFQHWVYENPEDAAQPSNCDKQWSQLWDRFMKVVDWRGLEDIKATGWHRKLHIHTYPLYYVEYGLAQLGAVLVWAKALNDQPQAVADYRKALALGGTVTLPDLYAAAGAKFAFDADTLQIAVDLIEKTIAELDA